MNFKGIPFSEFELGDTARDYIRGQLESARGLSREVHSTLDLSRHDVKTVLPSDTSDAGLVAFESGGVIPPAEVHEMVVSGVPQMIKVVETAYFYPVAEIAKFLSGGPDRICIIDNRTDISDSPPYTEGASYNASWKNELYPVIAGDGSNLAQIEECLYTSDMIEPLLMFFVSGATLKSPGTGTLQLSQADLTRIASRISGVMVGAYDGEGFLLWAP